MAAWRKYTYEALTEAVAVSNSIADVLRHLGLAQAGGSHTHISRTIKKLGIDTSHFRPHSNNGHESRRKSAAEVLVYRPRGSGREKPYLLRRALLDIGRNYECAICGAGDTWQGVPLRLHVDHVDGDFHNNVASNLRFLCPNCHSQTPNFSGLSRGKYTGSYTRIGRVDPGKRIEVTLP